MKRVWFTYDDGTYYRNCPLIQREIYAASRRARFALASQLHDEWKETFRRGPQYKEVLGRREIGVPDPRTPLSVLFPGLQLRWSPEALRKADEIDSLTPKLPPPDLSLRWHYDPPRWWQRRGRRR